MSCWCSPALCTAAAGQTGPASSPSWSAFRPSCAARASPSTCSISRSSAATPATTARGLRFWRAPRSCLPRAPADLVVVSCWSALQYTAAVAVAERVRCLHPAAVIAAEGYHVSVRPDDFDRRGRPVRLAHRRRGRVGRAVTIARAVAGGERETGVCRSLEGRPLPLDAAHAPDFAAYPYAGRDLPELGVFLSRGCPYNAPACLLRPGGGGWHAYPPHVAVAILTGLSELAPARIDVLDPAFGYDPVWRHAVLEGLAAADRRDLAITVAGRPADLTRGDVDRLYEARLRLRLDVGTLSRELLSRTGQAPQPQQGRRACPRSAHLRQRQGSRDRGLVHVQPARRDAGVGGGDPRRPAGLRRGQCPTRRSSSRRRRGRFCPPATRPRTSRRRRRASARASRGRSGGRSRRLRRPPPSRSWRAASWPICRPATRATGGRASTSCTSASTPSSRAEARRGLRSHETVGSAASGVPHGWWVEARWH